MLCPICESENTCAHHLLTVDLTFRTSNGGALYEAFEARLKVAEEAAEELDDGEQAEYDEGDEFDELLDTVDSLADYDLTEDAEGGAGQSSTYRHFYCTSGLKVAEAVREYQSISQPLKPVLPPIDLPPSIVWRASPEEIQHTRGPIIQLRTPASEPKRGTTSTGENSYEDAHRARSSIGRPTIVVHGDGVMLSVAWGNDVNVSLRLTSAEWTKVLGGEPLVRAGEAYYYEGEIFQDYWEIEGGLGGELRVTYGDDGGVGFEGTLSDADVRLIVGDSSEMPPRD